MIRRKTEAGREASIRVRRRRACAASVAALLAAATPACPAFAVELEREPGSTTMYLSGDIVAGDETRLAEFLEAAGPDLRRVALDSYGGDVMAAVAMGRAINRRGLGTVVMPGGQCNSACFFVWVAGAPRYNQFGIIGVHRPYAAYFGTPTEQGFEDLEAQLYAEFEAYLAGMQIPRPIIDTMLSTPNGELHVLTEMELRTIPALGARGAQP